MKLINNTDVNKYIHKKNKPKNELQGRVTSFAQSPINRSRSEVSFKGAASLLSKMTPQYSDYKKILEIASKDIDNVGNKLLKDLTDRGTVGKKIFIDGDKISFKENTFLKSLIDSATFPVTKLPFLLTDFTLSVLKKVPVLKKPAQVLYDSEFFSIRRLSSKTNDDINMLKGIIERTSELIKPLITKGDGVDINYLAKEAKNPKSVSDGLFETANKFFNPKTGNYNTVHERTLNRLVTGLIPATFLANDAYNLSVLCGDKKNASLKEKDSRFNQEVSRVSTTAYLQLITLGSLTKVVNSSPAASALISATTVLFSETFSRLANGKPINFISPEKAKEINKKNALKEEKTNKNKPVAPSIDSSVKTLDSKVSKKNTSLLNFGENSNKTKKDNKEQKTLITFNSLVKGVGLLIGAGFTLSFLKNSSFVNKKLNLPVKDTLNKFFDFWKKNVYQKLVKKDFEISQKDFRNVIDKLKASKHENLANKYSEIVGDAANNSTIRLYKNPKTLVQVDNSLKPVIDTIIQPFQFVWNTLALPYKIVKNITHSPIVPIEYKIANGEKVSHFQQTLANISKEVFGKAKDKESKTSQEIFVTSIEKVIKKANELDSKKITQKEFNDFVKSSVLRSFNSTTQSNYSNTDLGTVTKIASSAVTSAFLVSDNYNMVMLKSNGENKADAKQKAQERAVQRVSALFYQTLFMKWFNSTFGDLYHSSLGGMATVSGANTVATEVFTRKSIGMPLGAKSSEELAEIDYQNLNRKGLAGKYFRFMSLLTGKKPLAKKQPIQSTDVKNADNKNAFELLGKQDKKVATTDLLSIYGSNNK